MTIRIIVRSSEASALAHGAANAPEITYKTFDVELPEVEEHLRARVSNYENRELIGVELLRP